MRHKLLRELAVFAFFVLLAVALTWPLATQLPTAVNDLGDPLLNAWILDWVAHAITHEPARLFHAPIFHPGILPLAYSENLVAIALLLIPLHLAGASPVVLHNVAFILGFALSGYGAYVLARMVSKHTIGAIVGGIFFGFCSYKFDHLAHLQIIFSAWVPLALAALLAFWERANWRRGLLLALAFVANGLTNIYFLMFLSVATLFTLALLAIVRPRGLRFYLGLAASFVLALAILLPFLLPYRMVSKHYNMVRGSEEVRNGSADWSDWLVGARPNRVYGDVPADEMFTPERQLFPGLMIVVLAVAGWFLYAASPPVILSEAKDPLLVSRRGSFASLRMTRVLDVLIVAALALLWASIVGGRVEIKAFGTRLLAVSGSDIPFMATIVLIVIRFAIRLPNALGGVPLRVAAERSRFDVGAWVAALWIVIGVVGSLGLNGSFYQFFYRRFEPFQAMRVAARFAIIAYVGLAVWGALGAAAIIRAREGWKRTAAATLLVVLMIVEVAPSIRWEHAPTDTPPVYAWLAKTRVGPVIELPFSGDGVDYLYLLGSAVHRVPTVNGTSGFFPPEFWKLRDPDSRDAFDEMLPLLEQWGVRLIVVHGDMHSNERQKKVTEFLRRQLATHRLEFVRRFDNRRTGDYVFAIRRNLPNWASLRAPEVPDGAGNFPNQNLERFLDGKDTHSNSIVVTMDYPLPWMTVKSPLRISGWALSPHGIRRATAIFHGGRRRYEMQLVRRPDVLALFHWQYLNERPGFELVLPERPKGIPMDTDVQVEIEDHAGRVRRGKDTLIRWENH